MLVAVGPATPGRTLTRVAGRSGYAVRVVEHGGRHGTDPAAVDARVQGALDRVAGAGGGTVRFEAGVYPSAARWRIGSGTHLRLDPGAVVLRAGPVSGLVNVTDGTTGGYGQAAGIVISGGTWDGSRARHPVEARTLFTFGHVDSLELRGVTMRELGGTGHFVEVNSSRRVRIAWCLFDGLPGDVDPARPSQAEMIQLDAAGSPGWWPYAGPYDGTPCDDALVLGCTFRRGMRGVGTHSQVAGRPHTGVRVIGNRFDGLTGAAVAPLNWSAPVIACNAARAVGEGISVAAVEQSVDPGCTPVEFANVWA